MNEAGGGGARLRVTMFADAYLDYVVSLSRALAPLVDLTLVSPTDWRRHLDGAGLADHVTFEGPRMRDPRSGPAARRLVRIIDDVEADVVHVQATSNPWINIAVLIDPLVGPTVETVHDVVRHRGDRRTPRSGALTARWWRRRVDRFIVHTPGLGRQLTDRWRIPIQRQSVVAHGELGSRYPARDHDGAEPEPRTILFFGRVWPYKGLDVLVAALTTMAPDRPTRLIVAGQGQALGRYLDAVPDWVDCEVIDRYVSHHEVHGLFCRATLLCLPYREASQSGVAALAVGLGVPMVASDVGGVGESLRHGVDALFVPPDQPIALGTAIEELLGDPERRAAMSARLLERAAGDLSWPVIARQTVAVYRSVLT